jgi:hypothetical protein
MTLFNDKVIMCNNNNNKNQTDDDEILIDNSLLNQHFDPRASVSLALTAAVTTTASNTILACNNNNNNLDNKDWNFLQAALNDTSCLNDFYQQINKIDLTPATVGLAVTDYNLETIFHL